MHLLSTLLVLAPQVVPAPEAERPREYWAAIVANGYSVPEGADPLALLVELSAYLGSPDSKLRDDFGYGIAANWIYTQELLGADELGQLQDLWVGNLSHELGSEGDDSVLLRSFSALNLSLIAAFESKQSFMGAQRFATLLDAALAYLAGERDLRGWEERTGWLHSAAHTADLLKFLARCERLEQEQQRKLLFGIARRLRDTRGYVFVHGEDDRLAAACVSVLAREDAHFDAVVEFIDELSANAKRSREAGTFDPELFAAVQNSKNFLRALHVRFARAQDLSPELQRIAQLVLEALGRM